MTRVGVPSQAKKLEERAEEIVDAYLRAGVDQGDWRALDALVNRAYGKPKETIATEQPQGSNVSRFLDQLSMEELEALSKRGRLESLSAEEMREQLRRFSPEERRDWLRRLNDQAAAHENDEEAASSYASRCAPVRPPRDSAARIARRFGL